MLCMRFVILFGFIIFVFFPINESKALTTGKNLPQITLNLNDDRSIQQYDVNIMMT